MVHEMTPAEEELIGTLRKTEGGKRKTMAQLYNAVTAYLLHDREKRKNLILAAVTIMEEVNHMDEEPEVLTRQLERKRTLTKLF